MEGDGAAPELLRVVLCAHDVPPPAAVLLSLPFPPLLSCAF